MSLSQNNMLPEIRPYATMTAEEQAEVDAEVAIIRKLDSKGLLYYGMEAQKDVMQYANRILSEIASREEGESIEDIIAEIIDVSDDITPKKSIFGAFRKPFKSDDSKRVFVGKVDVLREKIETQTGRLVEDNINHEEYIRLLLNNISELTKRLNALDYYILQLENEKANATQNAFGMEITYATENDNYYLERLKRKRDMFYAQIVESMQVAVSARMIQNNNEVLSDRLQELLVTYMPMLQNQIMLRASIQNTKEGLDTCEKVRQAVTDVTKRNVSDLMDTMRRLGIAKSSDDRAALAEIGKSIMDIANGMKEVHNKAREDIASAEKQINSSDEKLDILFRKMLKELEA